MTETNPQPPSLIQSALNAYKLKRWDLLEKIGSRLIETSPSTADGYYFSGVAARSHRNYPQAVAHFSKGLEIDINRYDIAVELADVYSSLRQNAKAAELLNAYTDLLSQSSRYLDFAGTVYVGIGMPERAWPLYKKANDLQPNTPVLQANLANCAVYQGEIALAKATYSALIAANPGHRKNHYHLSRLEKAQSFEHVEQMQDLLKNSPQDDARNTPLYFALGKELEDLAQWESSFNFYQRGCNAIRASMNYDANDDVAIIDAIIKHFDRDWFANTSDADACEKTPIFIVGLPRAGTTLVERVLSSHTQVSSLRETMFLQLACRRAVNTAGNTPLSPELIEAFSHLEGKKISADYMESVAYRLGDEPFFIEKLPLNILFLGLINKAWPNAKIIHIRKSPMSACFSVYKQVFTWAYRFSYSQEDLAKYYVAYDRLSRHWKEVLGNQLIELSYEKFVADNHGEVESLLAQLALPFEPQCLQPEQNQSVATSASSIQIRDGIHTGSVDRWRNYAPYLEPIAKHFDAQGIRWND